MKTIFITIALAFLTLSLAFTSAEKRTIIIDVSHGGQDNGVTVNNINEKAVALSIANKIKDLNANANLEIILTRDSDEFMTLRDRAKMINNIKPEFVISIHANKYIDEAVKGTEIYISDNTKEKEASNALALKLKTAFQFQNSSIKKADFYLLKHVNHPIAMVELGFLSNKKDRALLTQEEGQLKIAKAILNAIE